jgi:hypothetical protein
MRKKERVKEKKKTKWTNRISREKGRGIKRKRKRRYWGKKKDK